MAMETTNDGKRIKESYEISKTRKFLGGKLIEATRDFPQGTGSTYFAMEPLQELKKKLCEQNPHVTYTSLFTKLAAEGLKKHPIMNSALIDNKTFYVYDSINIGVGVGLEEGVMMVVIKEAQDKNIFEISDELQEDITLLKNKKLPWDRMMGSTFTVSNMGMLGVEQFTPFTTVPETAILGIGQTYRRPWVNEDDSITAHDVCCLSCTVNHAAVDGLHGGLYLKTMLELVKHPADFMGL